MKIDLNKILTFEDLSIGDVVELKLSNVSDTSWYAMKSYHEEIDYVYVDLQTGEIFQDYKHYPIVRKLNAVLTEEELN